MYKSCRTERKSHEETEKIEIMRISTTEGYLRGRQNVYETGKKMTALADKVADEGYDAVFLMGVGGTWDELMQLEYLMNKFGDRDLEVYLIPPPSGDVMDPGAADREVRRAHRLRSPAPPRGPRGRQEDEGHGRARHAATKPEGPIARLWVPRTASPWLLTRGSGGCEKGYYLADCFGLRLLNRRGCFPKFDLFIRQTRDIWKDMLDIRKRFF